MERNQFLDVDTPGWWLLEAQLDAAVEELRQQLGHSFGWSEAQWFADARNLEALLAYLEAEAAALLTKLDEQLDVTGQTAWVAAVIGGRSAAPAAPVAKAAAEAAPAASAAAAAPPPAAPPAGTPKMSLFARKAVATAAPSAEAAAAEAPAAEAPAADGAPTAPPSPAEAAAAEPKKSLFARKAESAPPAPPAPPAAEAPPAPPAPPAAEAPPAAPEAPAAEAPPAPPAPPEAPAAPEMVDVAASLDGMVADASNALTAEAAAELANDPQLDEHVAAKAEEIVADLEEGLEDEMDEYDFEALEGAAAE